MTESDRIFAQTLIVMAITLGLAWGLPAKAEAESVVRYACSNQVYRSFSDEHAKAFSEQTGIEVELKRASSSESIGEILSGRMDVASSARELDAHEKTLGLREFPFCVAPLALITKAGCGIETIRKDRISAIFKRSIANWRDVGGPDVPITVVIPSEGTAAHRNFRREVTGTRTLFYDFSANDSTGVIDLVRYLPCGALSFVSYGAVSGDSSIKALNIDGLAPTASGYPYVQTFRLVTRNEPTRSVQAFIDYTFSQAARSIMERHGMVPLPQQGADSK